jgi:polyphosphate glucokinase
LSAAFDADYVVIGGGHARELTDLPVNCRMGDNANAFTGGFRIWADTAKTPLETATVPEA